MKSCPTCGATAEAQAPFCPCCGTSFVESAPSTPPPAAEPKAPVATPPPLPFEEKEHNGHALPIVILSVLAALIIGLGTLWATGGLDALFGKQEKKAEKQDSVVPDVQTTPAIAATYGDGQQITTQHYLAHLYLAFEDIYVGERLYEYAQMGIDPWAEQYPYGDEEEKLSLSDYIIRTAQDRIRQQIVLQQLMESKGIQWMPDEKAEVEQALAKLAKDAYLPLGFDNDSYATVLKQVTLNERSTFFGLYGKGGDRAVKESVLRNYFAGNYLSYRIISIPLTDAAGQALDKDSAAYAQILEKMSNYMSVYQAHGFDTVYVLHSGKPVENSRNDVDSTTMDAALAQAVRSVEVGKVKIVEYSEKGTTPTIALIQRMDIYDTTAVYDNAVEEILTTMKYNEFAKEVQEAMAALTIEFDPTVVANSRPRDMLDVLAQQ